MRLPCLRSTTPLVSLLLAIAVFTTLTAADAPTREQWAPVISAITSNSPDAEAQLTNTVTQFPQWADGWIAFSRFETTRKNPEKAWEYARKALAIERTNADAVTLGMQALIDQNRGKDAIKVGQAMVGNADLDRLSDGRGGWIGYYAALAAQQSGDIAQSRDYLRQAKSCSGTSIPAEFIILEARLALADKDPAQAEALLDRAVKTNPQQWDAWYELGRVRSVLAEGEQSITGKQARLEGALSAFTTITVALPKDHEAWWAMARANLALARLDVVANADPGTHLRTCVAQARRATDVKPDFTAAWVTLGEALVRIEEWDNAVVALERAQALGADDDGTRGNLATALQKVGRAADALALSGTSIAGLSPADLLTRGLSARSAQNYSLATMSLQAAADHTDLANDASTRGPILRFLGHTNKEWAAADPVRGDEHLDAAAIAYQQAGDIVDYNARRQFAALQAGRNARLGYQAGWVLLGWDATSFRGLALVAANYGASRAWANPLHYVIWGLIIGLPFLLFIKSLFRRGIPANELLPARDPPTDRRQRQGARSSNANNASSGSSVMRPQTRMTPAKKQSALTERKDRREERKVTDNSDAQVRPTAPRRSAPAGRRAQLPETEEIKRPGDK